LRKHKYNATKTVVDGITFASKAEAKRYAELKLLWKAKEIFELHCQRKLPLHAPGSIASLKPIGHYIADFSYETKDGDCVVEDVKGFKTPLYRWKKKHVEAQYGIKIVEIK
jgi:hypothetical protein